MPLRNRGLGVEAFYPATAGPTRRAGRREKLPIEHRLRGSETAEGLASMFGELIDWMTKLYGMDRIGRQGIQAVVNWMDLTAWLIEGLYPGCQMPAVYIAAPTGGRWVKQSIKNDAMTNSDDLDDLADDAVAVMQRWYAADHGTAADHQLVIDAMTLAYRLIDTQR